MAVVLRCSYVMVLRCGYHGYMLWLPWLYAVVTMVVRCGYHGCTLWLPWYYHAVTLEMPTGTSLIMACSRKRAMLNRASGKCEVNGSS